MKKLLMVTITLLALGCSKDKSFSASTTEPLETNSDPNGPIVKITQAPANTLIQQENQVGFTVTERSNPIQDVTCTINKIALPCDWLKGVLKILPLPVGKYTFEIIAEDSEGLKGVARANWSVHNLFLPQTENYKIISQNHAVDILFVIDNSSSMRDEQKKISQRFDRFVEQIQNSDWQIGLTTTDTLNVKEQWSDGKLHAFDSNNLFLKSSMDIAKAQSLFAKHVQRKESGTDTETGIAAVYRSIERSVNPKTPEDKAQSQFYRKDAALAVVIVSDEDESKNGLKNKGDELLKLVNSTWSEQKKFQFNSIIVHTNECLSNGGFTMGDKYEALSIKTGGVVGDICANNYSQILKDIGKGVSSLQKSYTLKCEPQDVDQDGKADVVVTESSSKKVPGYKVVKNQILFDQALPNGDYNFEYYCLGTK
ncbi:MAG: VWA domain-containing protein [Bdellovibrionaceae bacterium]|nr:VWA domain-containing protein [Pseudobdellovibrionaceae bacterium]